MELALLFCVLLQVADALTTLRVIAKGGHEANPAVAWLMDCIGVVPALVAYKTLVVGAAVVAYIFAPWWALAGLCAVYAGVVAWNVRVMVGLTPTKPAR